jgi:hypothetical protein
MSVAQLTSMGFSQEDAEQALQNHKTIEAAVEHLFSIAPQPEADLQSVSQWLEQKEAVSQAVAEDKQDTGDETAEKPASVEDATAIQTAGEEKEAAEEAAGEQEVDMIRVRAEKICTSSTALAVEKAAFTKSLPEVDGGIEHCHTSWHDSADLEHLSAAEPVEDDMPPATQTIGGDDASRWARWIPADSGTVDASKRATTWDRAQVLLSKSMSSLRTHVSERKQQEKVPSGSQNSAEEVAEASPVESAEVETQEAAGDEIRTLQAAAKWQEMVYKVSAVPAAKAQGAPDEPWDHAQVILSKSMSALRTHTHPHVAKWHEIMHKVSASVTSQSTCSRPESNTDAVVATAAAVPEDGPVHNNTLDESTDVDAPVETAASVGAAAEGSDEAEQETAAAHGSRLDESSDVDALLDRAQVLWSQSACALRSQATALLQHRQTSMQDSSQDAATQEVRTSHFMGEQALANDKSQPSPDREEEAPVAAIGEADGIASPPNADAAPDGASTAETDREQAFENATRFDHAQVFLSVSMAALRQGISRIHAAHPISVQ